MPAPSTLSFDASSIVVSEGDAVTLSWSANNVTGCSASGDWSGSLPAAGTRVVTAGPEQRNFSLTCAGPSGSVVSIVSLAVTQVVTASWARPTTNSDGSPLTDLAGYVINYGSSSGEYTESVVISNPATLSADLLLSPGSYFFVIVSENSAGVQSKYSSERSKVVY